MTSEKTIVFAEAAADQEMTIFLEPGLLRPIRARLIGWMDNNEPWFLFDFDHMKGQGAPAGTQRRRCVWTTKLPLPKMVEHFHPSQCQLPPTIDRSRYPWDCPKCKSPAYLSLFHWDCSNRSCK